MSLDREKIGRPEKDRPADDDEEKQRKVRSAPVVRRERDTLPLEGE